jgi:hypothetical protein
MKWATPRILCQKHFAPRERCGCPVRTQKPRYRYVRFERASCTLQPESDRSCYTIPIDPSLLHNHGATLMLRSRAGWFLCHAWGYGSDH